MLFPVSGTLILAPSPLAHFYPFFSSRLWCILLPSPGHMVPGCCTSLLSPPRPGPHHSGLLQHGHRYAPRSGRELQGDCLSPAVTPAPLGTGPSPVGALSMVIWVDKTPSPTRVFDSGSKFSGAEVNRSGGECWRGGRSGGWGSVAMAENPKSQLHGRSPDT